MSIDPYLVTRAASSFPSARVETLTQSRPGLRARSIAHAAYRAADQHVRNIVEASKYKSDDVASDALPEIRAELSNHLRRDLANRFTNPLDGLRRQAERARDEADKAAEPYRLRLDPESTTQLVRTDQAWNNTIRPALEQGKQWDEIIPTLDADGLLAVERFAPGHESRIRDRFHQHEVPGVLEGIRTASERRLPDVVPPEGRVALREHQDTVAALDFAETAMRWSEQATDRDSVSIEIGLKRLAYQHGAHRPADTSPEGQADYAASLGGAAASTAIEHGPGAVSAA